MKVLLRKKHESSDQPENEDPIDEMLEWAKNRAPIVSQSTPGAMGSPHGMKLELEPHPSPSESMPSGVETVAPTKLKPQARVLVVVLGEGTSDRGEARLFDDAQEASHFIETLLQSGLNQNRAIAFWSMPISINVTYRPVVALEQPEQAVDVVS